MADLNKKERHVKNTMKRQWSTTSAFVLVFSLSFFLPYACKESTETDGFESFDRKGMLTSIASQVILPAFTDFSAKATSLKQTIATFSTTPNETNLVAAQQAWTETAKAWKIASLFSQGPIDDQFITATIQFSSVNYPNIEKAITDGTVIDNAYVESKGGSLKGIPALEYLLFDQNKVNATIISTYSGANGAKRLAYLTALSVNLEEKANLIANSWKSTGGNYVATFTNSDGREITSSLGVLVNKLIAQVYTIRDERLGAPLGKRNNGTPQPALVEAPLSDVSNLLLINELKGVENTLSANGSTGIYALLDKLNAQSGGQLLSSKINAQFTAIYTKINALPKPLRLAVTSSTTDVNGIYDEVRKLQVLMEVDMVNNLGVLLTFSDNDGD